MLASKHSPIQNLVFNTISGSNFALCQYLVHLQSQTKIHASPSDSCSFSWVPIPCSFQNHLHSISLSVIWPFCSDDLSHDGISSIHMKHKQHNSSYTPAFWDVHTSLEFMKYMMFRKARPNFWTMKAHEEPTDAPLLLLPLESTQIPGSWNTSRKHFSWHCQSLSPNPSLL